MTNIYDEERSGWPHLLWQIVEKVNGKIWENLDFKITALLDQFSQLSQTVLYNVVWQARLLQILCALDGCSIDFLFALNMESDDFLSYIVADYTGLGCCLSMWRQNQSIEWGHTSSSQKPLKYWQIVSPVFWDRKGLLLMDFMERTTTINNVVYCNNIKKPRRVKQKNGMGILSSLSVLCKIILVHILPHAHKGYWIVPNGSC